MADDGLDITDPKLSEVGGGGQSDSPPPAPKAQPEEHPEQQQQQYPAGASEKDIHDEMTRLQQQIEQENKQYNETAIPMYKKMMEMLNQPRDAGLTMPQAPAEQNTGDMQQMWKQNRHDLQKSAWGYLAVALPLAALMGSRGGWAMSGAWGGLGQGLSEVVKGYDNKADEAFQIWQKQGSLGQQKYREQMQQYKQILANRGYNLEQMSDMIKTTAKLYGDKRLTDTKTWNELRQELALKEKAQQKYDKQMHKSTRDILNKTGKSDVYKAYASEMESEYGVDIYKDELTPEEQKIYDEHPFSKFWEEHKKTAKEREAEKKPDEKEQTPDEKTNEKAIDSMNNFL